MFQGYDAIPTSEGVSRATTRTVVYSSLAILGLDFILTAVMFGEPVMRMRTVEISVGGFMIAGVLALVVLALKVSGLSQDAGHQTYQVHALFDNTGALKTQGQGIHGRRHHRQGHAGQSGQRHLHGKG